jgi:hypothetical protein
MSRPKIILGLLSGLVALVVVALVLTPGGPSAVDTSLPNPNGYDFIARAGPLARAVEKSPDELERGELTALVRDNEAALELARQGLALPCKLPLPANMDEWNRRLRALPQHKALAFAFVAEGRLRALQGDAGGAARSFLDTIALGVAVTRGGFILNLMEGQAFAALGAGKLAEISATLNATECRAAADGLRQYLRQFPPVEESEANEDYFLARFSPLRWRFSLQLNRWTPSGRAMRESIRVKARQRFAAFRQYADDLSARAEAGEKRPGP